MESVRLTLGDLEIIWLRHERMPKRKQVPEQTMASWYHQKSAEVVVSRQRAPINRGSLTQGRRTEC